MLIFGTFTAPVILAWLFASGFVDMAGHKRLNHGALLSPPVDLRLYPDSPALGVLRSLPPAAWAMVYVSSTPCAEDCVRVLREMAVIRTLIGNEGTRVSVIGVVSQHHAQEDADLPRIVEDPNAVDLIARTMSSRGTNLAPPFIAFVDWRGQLMMHYSPDAPPADIKEDLQRLLRASAIR